ncbi:MAG: adenosylcobinamide-GDP ribazoletransferase [Acidobacteriota bacterium]|nr:adenosylcobinamide-GDP ribazoletransferase [Acidobacteriota bacterium]
MKSLVAAFAFLTRIPVPSRIAIGPEDVGGSAKWFPLVGLFLGCVQAALALALRPVLPRAVIAVLLVTLEAFLTGALHMDGLADTADGLGGGRDREHALSIMRDHAIGSYGAVALILLIGLKVTAITSLLTHPSWWVYLLLAPLLGRWAVLPLTRFIPYARDAGSVVDHMRTGELIWGTVMTAIACVGLGRLSGLICWAAVIVGAALFGRYCRRKIGGITGDTLGANVQLCEGIVLLAGLILS